ncbi:MAG: hypothetical protein QOE82_3719 [Thermoanaerobaculia bacterium]|jgi:hypothetical protein|nr:hypothetical protein [Thermoanaerobaculia bacterium]
MKPTFIAAAALSIALFGCSTTQTTASAPNEPVISTSNPSMASSTTETTVTTNYGGTAATTGTTATYGGTPADFAAGVDTSNPPMASSSMDTSATSAQSTPAKSGNETGHGRHRSMHKE